MPKKPNIEKILKRSPKERARMLCNDYATEAWGNPQKFTDEEQLRIRRSFTTNKQIEILNQMLANQSNLRSFFTFISQRMAQVLDVVNSFTMNRLRYIESVAHQELFNKILELAKENEPLRNHVAALFKQPVEPMLFKLLSPSTIQLTPYCDYKNAEKTFIEVLKNSSIKVTERIRIVKEYIEAAYRFMDTKHCRFKMYETLIENHIDNLKYYLEVMHYTDDLCKNFHDFDWFNWPDAEVFTKGWLPPEYEEIQINKKRI